MTPDREQLREEIAARVEAFARERGYRLSSAAESIINDLVQMHFLLGDFYCPCQPDNAPDAVCVCQAVRQGLVEEMGACFCYLFLASRIEALT